MPRAIRRGPSRSKGCNMFDARLARARGAIEARLAREFATLNPLPVTEAMRYASHGGKALRGFLVLESGALHEIDAARALHLRLLPVHQSMFCESNPGPVSA